MSACSAATCGNCGRCTAAWEQDTEPEPVDTERDDVVTEFCIYCGRPYVDDTCYPFCSKDCSIRAETE